MLQCVSACVRWGDGVLAVSQCGSFNNNNKYWTRKRMYYDFLYNKSKSLIFDKDPIWYLANFIQEFDFYDHNLDKRWIFSYKR